MVLGFLAGVYTFQDLLNQVNAPSRTVTLVAEQLISRASGIAEAAVNTGAQYVFGFLSLGRYPSMLTICRFALPALI